MHPESLPADSRTLSDKSWILYTGLFEFPVGNACSRRVLGIAQTLACLGEKVVVGVGLNDDPVLRRSDASSALNGSILQVGLGEYNRRWGHPRKLLESLFLNGERTLAWLDSQPSQPKAIILYGSPAPYLFRLLDWCRKHRVPLVCDLVEWYSGGQLAGGRLGPYFWSNEFALRRLVPRTAGTIGISKLLCNHFRTANHPVVRIPPTLDTGQISYSLERSSRNQINLVYAGVPGKKDLIGNVLEALGRIDREGKRFRLRILGVDEAYLQSEYPEYPAAAVEVMGRRTQVEVLQFVQQADFSVLLRPQMKYANAGFPTKVVESLACGTPVICNHTSDLQDYVHHRVEGIICASHSAEAMIQALKEVESLDKDTITLMRRSARRRAEQSFHFFDYAPDLRDFLDQILHESN